MVDGKVRIVAYYTPVHARTSTPLQKERNILRGTGGGPRGGSGVDRPSTRLQELLQRRRDERQFPRGGIAFLEAEPGFGIRRTSMGERSEQFSDPKGTKGKAEQGRIAAEQGRVAAENERKAEAQRHSAHEEQRQLAEEMRAAGEAWRMAHETAREVAEELRQANESLRQAAEGARAAAEEARHSNETLQLAAEEIEIVAKELRQAAETLREAGRDQKRLVEEIRRTGKEQASGESLPEPPPA
jgi:hypothetical protein